MNLYLCNELPVKLFSNSFIRDMPTFHFIVEFEDRGTRDGATKTSPLIESNVIEASQVYYAVY